MGTRAELYWREYGAPQSGRPALCFFARPVRLRRQLGIARHFETDWHVIIPDLRNHGRSPHVFGMCYADMATDLLTLLDQLDIERCIPVEHSMGGKVAMALALRYGQRVVQLVVADIAPVAYAHDFGDILAAFHAVDLQQIRGRRDAEAMMAAPVHVPAMRQFLLQNLVRHSEGWSWRLGLDEIKAGLAELTGFDIACPPRYKEPTLFLHSELSDDVSPKYHLHIESCFRDCRIRAIKGVGHWLYAEKPVEFIAELTAFLQQ